MTISASQITSLANGLDAELNTLSLGLLDKLTSTALPLLGKIDDAVEQGAAILAKVEAVRTTLSNAFAALQDGLDHPAAAVASAINDALANAGVADLVQATGGADNSLTIAFEDDASLSYTHALASDLGMGSFGLSTTGAATVNLDYHLGLSASLDASGHFSLTTPNNAQALSLSFNASAPDFQAGAQLGFLHFATRDASLDHPGEQGVGSFVFGNFGVDLQGNATVGAAAQVDLDLAADLSNADLPSISANLKAQWQLGDTPTVSFNNVTINFGQFVTEFIDPILQRLDPILTPLHELAAIVNTDLRPLDRFSGLLDVAGAANADGSDTKDGKVTLVDLLKLADTLAGRNDSFYSIVQIANFVTQVTDWIAFFEGKSFGPDQYDLGSFDISANLPANIDVTAASANLNGFLNGLSGGAYSATDSNGESGANVIADVVHNTNFAFPLLTDPTQVFKLLLGQDANLFTFNVGASFQMGSIAADGTPTDTVQIASLPVFSLAGIVDISLALSGAIQAAFNVSGGYDTHGLAEFAQQFAQNGTENFADLANGFYLTGGAGAPPILSLAASIQGDIIAQTFGDLAEIDGGANLTGQLAVNLTNTVHLDEFPTDLASLFQVSGALTAGLEGHVTLHDPFKLVSWTPYTFASTRATLASFSTTGIPGLSGPIPGGPGDTGGTGGGGSELPTEFTVTTTNAFNAALASINAGGANAQSGANYTITIAAGATVTIDSGFAGFNLPQDASLVIVDNGVIVYDSASDVTIDAFISGTGKIDAEGDGALKLTNGNVFTGGLRIDSGTVELGAYGAAGGGDITFAANAHATLLVDPGASPGGTIFGLDRSDTIKFLGLGLTGASIDDNHVVMLTGDAGETDFIGFDPAADLTGLATKPDVDGTILHLIQLNYPVSSTDEFDAALNAMNVGGANAVAGAPYTIEIVAGASVSVDGGYPGVNLREGASLKILDKGEFDFDKSLTFDPIIAGVGSVHVDSGSIVKLTAANTYAGGTLIGGALDLADAGAGGTGLITFKDGLKSTLKIELGDAPANQINGFDTGDLIDFVGLSGVATTSTDANHVVTLEDAGNVALATLHIDPNQDLGGRVFVAQDDGAGGTKLRLIQTHFDISTTSQFNDVINSINIGGDNSAPGLFYTITITAPSNVAFSSGFPGLHLDTGDALGVTNNGVLSVADGADATFNATIGGPGNIDVAAGRLDLGNSNLFTGHVTIENGTLELGAQGAAGANPIIFTAGTRGTLEVDQGVHVDNIISGMLPGDVIRLDDVTTKTANLGDNNFLTISKADGNGGTVPVTTFNIDPTVDYTDFSFKTKADGSTGDSIVKVIRTTFYVASTADWNTAVKSLDVNGDNAWEDTNYKIILTGDFTLTGDLEAFNLTSGDQVTIVGNNHTIDGAGSYRGIFDYVGKIIGNDFTIKNALAQGGNGGSGGSGGGGGAGMGGGLFVAAGGDVTLNDVKFLNDAAKGGNGGAAGSSYTVSYNDGQGHYSSTTYVSQGGGGGGLGGNGGNTGGGGGGIGRGADGGDGIPTGATGTWPYDAYYGKQGILPQLPGDSNYNQLSYFAADDSGGGSAGTAGGAGVLEGYTPGSDVYVFGVFGGGGGASLFYAPVEYYYYQTYGGYYISAAGSGGYGGGGGGGTAGNGNFHGGSSGATGGFGGGGGGAFGYAYVVNDSNYGQYTSYSRPGTGGFAAGAGGAGDYQYVQIDANTYGYSYAAGGGGGGAGLGGGVYVQAGGKLTFGDGSLSGSSVAGGDGGDGAAYYLGGPTVQGQAGSAGSFYGAGIFMEGGNTLTLAPGAGKALVIADVIADEVGSIPPSNPNDTQYPTYQASLDVKGPGSVVLGATNTYSGGTSVEGGSFEMAAIGAAGSGAITLSGNGSLIVDFGDTPSNVIKGLLPNGTVDATTSIDLRGVGLETAAPIGANNVISLSGGTTPVTLNGDPDADYSGYHVKLASDNTGGTIASLALNTTAASEKDINDILRRIDVGGLSSVANTHYTITLTGDLSLNADLYAINLASGSSLTIDGAGHKIDGQSQYRGFFAFAGAFELDNLTIAHANVNGGAGASAGGGGGAGLGGALFVGSGAQVTLSNVVLQNDSAFGGFGGGAPGNAGGGGGGLGGAGGSSGGGGIGASATGGQNFYPQIGGNGIVLGADGGAGAVGSNYDAESTAGGGGAADFGAAGGGGGIGAVGTAGGFGGGGGGGAQSVSGGSGDVDLIDGGAGGFGGGGGGVVETGAHAGLGGFGGGGGGAITGATAGTGGYGAGNGSVADGGGGGGGGLGAGGAVFVESGGSLTYVSGSESGGNVGGGYGGFAGILGQSTSQGAAGLGLGSGFFVQGNATLNFAPVSGATLTISDVIADQTGTGGTGANAGAASVAIGGAGTVIFKGANTYSGATTVSAGSTLALGVGGVLGTGGLVDDGVVALNASGSFTIKGAVTGAGAIVFGSGAAVALTFATAAPQVTLSGFGQGDSIDLSSVTYAAGETLALNGGAVEIRSASNALLASLKIADADLSKYSLSQDTSSGTVLSYGGKLTAVNETGAVLVTHYIAIGLVGAALQGDVGADNTPVTVTGVTGGDLADNYGHVTGQYGDLYLYADGSYYYYPDAMPSTTSGPLHDVFHYTVGDGENHVASASLDIAIVTQRMTAAGAAANYQTIWDDSNFVIDIVDTDANVAANLDGLQNLLLTHQIATITHTNVSGADYSSYKFDYNGTSIVGQHFYYTNVQNQPYTSRELDLDGAGAPVRDIYSGVTGQSYYSYEYDYVNSAYAGATFFYNDVGQNYTTHTVKTDANGHTTQKTYGGVVGQIYTQQEEDYNSGDGTLARLVFSGVSGHGYASYEFDFVHGNYVGQKYFYPLPTGQAYTAIEADYTPLGDPVRTIFTGFDQQVYGYNTYEQEFVGGVYAGFKLSISHTPTLDSPYSSYEYDYDQSGFNGSKFYYTHADTVGLPFTDLEVDYDKNGAATHVKASGIIGQAYSSYEYGLNNGAVTGSTYFYTAGQPAGSSYAQDYDAAGNATTTRFFTTDVNSSVYNAYEVDQLNGVTQKIIKDNNDGTHTQEGYANGLAFTALGDDTFVGGASQTFVFATVYGQDTISDFYAHLSGVDHDTIQFAANQFADFNTMMAHTADSANGAVISDTFGDTLTLTNVAKTDIVANAGDFKFV